MAGRHDVDDGRTAAGRNNRADRRDNWDRPGATAQEFIDEVLHPFGARFTDDRPFRPVNIRAVYCDDEQNTVIVVWDGGASLPLGRRTATPTPGS